MKKILYSLMAIFAAVSLTSCEDFEPGGTATEKLAGNWICTIYASDGSAWEEIYDGEFLTYNTADNDVDKIWIDDDGNFWETKSKIDCDVNTLSFGKEGAEYENVYYEMTQKIWGGKITFDGAIAPVSGAKCDKIEFYNSYSDDEDELTYYIVGYRRTGFTEDDGEIITDWTLPAVQ